MVAARTWTRIRNEFERGAPWKELEALGVNKGTISKRAKREGWDTSKRRGARTKKKAKKAEAKKKPARKKKNSTRATSRKKKGNTRRKSTPARQQPPAPVDAVDDKQREVREVCKQVLLMARNAMVVAQKMIEKSNEILDNKKSNPSRQRAAGTMLREGTNSLHSASNVILKIQNVLNGGKMESAGPAPRVTAEQWVQGHDDLPP